MKNKYKLYLLSFFIPIFIFVISNFLMGNDFNFVSDLYDVDSQYVPLFKYLKHFFEGNGSILYSFSKELGGSMFSVFFYYLSCPLNILVLFFNNMYKFINILCLIKIGLCGFTFFYYLNSKSNKNLLINLSFSLCYALMGYNICYIKNIFWFDVVYAAPIVLLGIDKLINDGSIKLYILSLAFCIFCNYYISFSLCIFCLIYFVYQILLKNNINIRKVVFKFLFSSLICGGLCSIFLIPTIYEMLQLKNRIGFDSLFNNDYLNIFYVFYHFLIGSSDISFHYIYFVDSPHLYCSVLVFIFNILFIFNKKISKKEKIIVFFIQLFFIMSMIFDPLYLFWHGFSYTNGNPYRFSFLWTLFIILIGYKSIINFDYYLINKKKFLLICFACVFFLIFIFLFNSIILFNNGFEYILSFLFLICYIIIFLLLDYRKFLVLLVAFELGVNCFISVNRDNQKFNIINYDYLCVSGMDGYIRANSPSVNSSLYCNYGSSSLYLSTINNDVVNFFENSGSNALKLFIQGYYDSELMNSLLGIDYLVDIKGNLSDNDYALSLGYMVYVNDLKYNNSVDYQENILNSMTNNNYHYFIEYPFSISDIDSINYKNDLYDKYIYLDFNSNYIDHLYVNDKEFITDSDRVLGNFFRLSNYLTDDVNIKFSFYSGYDKSIILSNIKLYDFDYKTFAAAIDILKEQQLNVTKIEKNTLEGNIDVLKDDQYLFLSIPYEKGWNIYVDGNKVDYEKIYDAFIGIKLDKGHHDIKMVFYPYGLNVGICISVGSLVVLVLYLCKNKK